MSNGVPSDSDSSGVLSGDGGDAGGTPLGSRRRALIRRATLVAEELRAIAEDLGLPEVIDQAHEAREALHRAEGDCPR